MGTMRMSLKNKARPERFELPTLWFEARLLTFRKRLIFNHAIENLRLSFAGRMCRGVRKCGCLHVGSLQKSLQSSAIEIGATS
jgi:hypothetical protein